MFSCPSSILLPVAFFIAAARAFPGHSARGGTSSQCDTGAVQCCNTVMPSSSSEASSALGALGILPDSVYGLVGLGCSPITAIGVGSGATCTQQPVCCAENASNGLVSWDCSPVNVDL